MPYDIVTPESSDNLVVSSSPPKPAPRTTTRIGEI